MNKYIVKISKERSINIISLSKKGAKVEKIDILDDPKFDYFLVEGNKEIEKDLEKLADSYNEYKKTKIGDFEFEGFIIN